MLEIGTKAPDFALLDKNGEMVRLSDYIGKKIVLKKIAGKVGFGVVRSTYIIDEQGNIEKAMPKVKPDTNAAEILAYLAGE